jgi:hypothetical protein
MAMSDLDTELCRLRRVNHNSGREIFRLAAMRAFIACGDDDAVRVIRDLEVDAWLKPDEIPMLEPGAAL